MNKLLFIEAIRSTMKKNGHTQKYLENHLKIHQSQISKILRGDFSRGGKAIELLKEYSLYNEYSEDQFYSVEINRAVAEIWDGSPKMEKQLAKIIREVGRAWQQDRL